MFLWMFFRVSWGVQFRVAGAARRRLRWWGCLSARPPVHYSQRFKSEVTSVGCLLPRFSRRAGFFPVLHCQRSHRPHIYLPGAYPQPTKTPPSRSTLPHFCSYTHDLPSPTNTPRQTLIYAHTARHAHAAHTKVTNPHAWFRSAASRLRLSFAATHTSARRKTNFLTQQARKIQEKSSTGRKRQEIRDRSIDRSILRHPKMTRTNGIGFFRAQNTKHENDTALALFALICPPP